MNKHLFRHTFFVVALCSLSLVGRLSAQAPWRWYLTPPDWQAAGVAVTSMLKVVTQWGQRSAAIEIELTRTRNAFWAQYPSGPRFEGARREFAETLLARDLFQAEWAARERAVQQLSASTQQAVRQNDRALNAFLGAVSGRDGSAGSVESIPSMALPEFNAWVTALTSGVQQQLGREEVYRAALPEYQNYVVLRDRAEFLRSPASPLLSKDPDIVVQGIFLTCKKYTAQQAVDMSAALRRQTGNAEIWSRVATQVGSTAAKGLSDSRSEAFTMTCGWPSMFQGLLGGAGPTPAARPN